MKKIFLFAAAALVVLTINAQNVVVLNEVANYIDFQALSISDPDMTQATITSTSPYTIANGSVLLGFQKSDGTEAANSWTITESYNTTMLTPTWEGVDSLKAGTAFRAASGTTIALGAFRTSEAGKLIIYYQPTGDSNRGVEVYVYGELVEGSNLTGSGIKIDGFRPAYAGEIELAAGSYDAGDVVIKLVVNSSNIFGVRIDGGYSFFVKLLVNDSIAGSVYKTIYNDSLVSIEATPNYGYHFVQWSDGNITNPRTIELTQDTSFTAIFAKNTYAVTTASNNAEWGTTTGDAYVLYQEQTVIQAMPNYGYHFVRWNDGNSSNPRSVVVTQDTTYTATFAKKQYTITKISDLSQGSISGLSRAEYLDTVTLEAIPEYGYKFLRWSDGIKDNPRTFVLTQDTTFTSAFGYTVAGSCGDNNQLTWTFDSISGTLSISGEGALGSNYTYGLQAPARTTRLIIEDGVTSIGDYAFNGMGSTVTSLALPTTLTNIGNYAFAGFNNRKFNSLVLPNDIITIGAHAFDGASYLQTIYFGSLLEEIGASAFNGCTRVRQMTCLAEITPNVGTDGLTSISSLAELYVPNEYLFDYQIDTNWSRFVLKTIGATEATVTNNDVKVVADDNTATLTWPTNDNADSYSIEITKDGVVFCTLVFNANGQLTGIAFAPSRDRQPHAPAATMTANGMQFTVTGLNSGTNYAFSVEAKNGETILDSYTGEFETTGAPEVATDLINPSDNIDGYHKILRDGQILILRGDKSYTLTGQEVR